MIHVSFNNFTTTDLNLKIKTLTESVQAQHLETLKE